MRSLPNITLFNWGGNPWTAPCALVDWHVPGYCYTSCTEQILDGGQGIARPGNGALDICLSAAKNADGTDVSGNVLVELYALDAFSSVPAADPTTCPSYRSICTVSVPVSSTGIKHAYHSFIATELDQLSVAPYDPLSGQPQKGGITFGIRLKNDPACASAATLRVMGYSVKINVGP